MNRDDWMKEADKIALERYAINATEMNGGDHIDDYDIENYLPEHWVEYKAEKYDLISLDQFRDAGFNV